MLVLTRKKEETIRIGDNIVVKVVRVKGNTVRIGIDAPESIAVRRGELPPRELEIGGDTLVGDDPANPIPSFVVAAS